MRITIYGQSLFRWCRENQRNYHNTRKALISALRVKMRKQKMTPEEIKRRMRVRNRCRRGYTEQEASLSDDEFEKLSAQKNGVHMIGKYNIHYVCEKLGVKYNTVFIHCIKRQRMTPREYLESKGYDLKEFEQ